MTAQTPIYGLKYIVEGEPLRDARPALEANAKTIEAALQAAGVAATGASDLLALAARVAAQETYVTGRHSGSQAIPTSAAVPTVLTYTSATSSPTALWSSGNPTRLPVAATGEYDLHVFVPWPTNATGTRGIAYRVMNNGAWVYFAAKPANSAFYGSSQTASATGIQLTAGQYVEVGAWQDSGVSLTVAQANPARASLRRVA